MTNEQIQQKIADLRSIMSEYKHELGSLEKELFRAVSEYQKALEEEKIKEIRQSLN